MIVFVDLNSDYYWEFGEIAKNIIAGKGFSYFHFADGSLEFMYDANAAPMPSAYMPPGYVAFMTPFMLLKTVVARNILILCIQFVAASLTTFIVYKFTSGYFSEISATIAALIVAFYPEFIYASTRFTPTSFYHLAIISIIYLLYREQSDSHRYNYWAIAVILGLLSIFRPA